MSMPTYGSLVECQWEQVVKEAIEYSIGDPLTPWDITLGVVMPH